MLHIKKKNMANDLRHFIKSCRLLSIMLGLIFLTGCFPHNKDYDFKSKETPHLYWKDIEVVIADIDKRHWYASSHHYKIYLTVENDEYGLSQSFTIDGSKAKEKWEWNKGDTVKAELFSWVMDSTGEVVRREINQVY